MEQDSRFVEAAKAAIQLSEMPLEMVYYIARMSAGALMNLAQTMPEIAELAQKDYVWKMLFERDFPNEFNFCGGYVPFYVVDADSPAFAWVANRADAEGPPWNRFYLHVRQIYVEAAKGLKLSSDKNNFASIYDAVRNWIDDVLKNRYGIFVGDVIFRLMWDAIRPRKPVYSDRLAIQERGPEALTEEFLVEQFTPYIDENNLSFVYTAARIAVEATTQKPVFVAHRYNLGASQRDEASSSPTPDVIAASCMWAARYLELKKSFASEESLVAVINASRPYMEGIIPFASLNRLFVSNTTKYLENHKGIEFFSRFLKFPRSSSSNKIIYIRRNCLACDRPDAAQVENSSKARFFCSTQCQQEFYKEK